MSEGARGGGAKLFVLGPKFPPTENFSQNAPPIVPEGHKHRVTTGDHPRKTSENPADPRRTPKRPRRTLGETPQSALRDALLQNRPFVSSRP